MKTKKKKIVLARETLKTLSSAELDQAAGGTWWNSFWSHCNSCGCVGGRPPTGNNCNQSNSGAQTHCGCGNHSNPC